MPTHGIADALDFNSYYGYMLYLVPSFKKNEYMLKQ